MTQAHNFPQFIVGNLHIITGLQILNASMVRVFLACGNNFVSSLDFAKKRDYRIHDVIEAHKKGGFKVKKKLRGKDSIPFAWGVKHG